MQNQMKWGAEEGQGGMGGMTSGTRGVICPRIKSCGYHPNEIAGKSLYASTVIQNS